MTLEQALIKHHTDLNIVMHTIGYKERSTSETYSNGEQKHKYIHEIKDGYYQVKKQNGSRAVYYGAYQDLDTAVRVRDWMAEHGWNVKLLKLCHRELGL
jgi:hypothetical protein